MRVLGIESSSLVASVALVTDDILTGEYTANFKKTHSQTLLPSSGHNTQNGEECSIPLHYIHRIL